MNAIKVPPVSIGVGDFIANYGRVNAMSVVGVFFVFRVTVTRWSFADGRASVHDEDLIYHTTQDVFVEERA